MFQFHVQLEDNYCDSYIYGRSIVSIIRKIK